jgi:hypothetical protein
LIVVENQIVMKSVINGRLGWVSGIGSAIGDGFAAYVGGDDWACGPVEAAAGLLL